MRRFEDIYRLAALHKGGQDQLEALLPRARPSAELQTVSNAVFLSEMSRRVFRAGLKHSMVDSKWPHFESVFKGFDPMACAMLSDEFIERCMADTLLIRHLGKLKSIRLNAQFLLTKSESFGSFGEYLCSWPKESVVELWFDLQKNTQHLGEHRPRASCEWWGTIPSY